jgi:DNA-directed RNA polymerase subunit RPC12/RpoP
VSYKCPRCGRTVQKLVPIDDADASSQWTDLIGVPYPCTDYVCITCARKILGISDEDLIQEEQTTKLETEFLLNLLKGRLAQVVIETIFQEFGYEVYPYGYESYLTNVIKFLRKGDANIPAREVRATPDLFVYDREFNDGFLLEIKATNTPDESRFWISKYTLQTYLSYWPETVLVVYCMPSVNIYCRQVGDIHPEELPVERSAVTDRENYVLNLKGDFCTLPEHFRLIEPARYEDFCQRIRGILRQFNQL